MDVVTGTVQSIIYAREASGYAVIKLDTHDGVGVIVVGCIPQPVAGESLSAQGQWVVHPSFGKQFEIKSGTCERTLPADKNALLAYLKSGTLHGVGQTTAKALLKEFGTSVLEVIEFTPEKLTKVKGISLKRATEIGRAFCEQNGVRRLVEFLAAHMLPPHHAMQLFKLYGDTALQMLKENPFVLVRAPFGIAFEAVDVIATSLGFTPSAPKRLEAALLYELTYNLDQGHCFIPFDKLLIVTDQLLGGIEADLSLAISNLEELGEVVRERVGSKDAVYLTRLHSDECYVAARALQMASLPPPIPHGLPQLLSKVEATLGITLAAEQRQAVLVAAQSRLFILTGGPGTGKTTTVRAILALFEQQQLTVALAAPTGRAAKRLSEVCGLEAKTIHRLLGVSPDFTTGGLGFAFNADQTLPYDVVIVDETSMVDISLMSSLLEAIDGETRLLLVGDADQLPAVGPGNVLYDFLRCDRIDAVTLTEIFRQAANSRIVTSAHAVNQGVVPAIENQGDLFCLSRAETQEAVDTIVELCTHRLPTNMGIPATNIQILSPTRKGLGGTQNLNEVLQQALNPPSPDKQQCRSLHTLFREGDRVMQIRNNYDLVWRTLVPAETGTGAYNGDIGQVTRISTQAERLTVRFEDGHEVDYTFDQLGELELAYAMTVHKAQGSEYQAVIFALLPCAPTLTTRRVLYTAMTRARELLIMVGQKQMLTRMVGSGQRVTRYAGLHSRLQGT